MQPASFPVQPKKRAHNKKHPTTGNQNPGTSQPAWLEPAVATVAVNVDLIGSSADVSAPWLGAVEGPFF
ncbi:hypothetical protein CGMCC3_g15569 [Colletotrichum fructicola]|nr:uncharacterized protein CGMCC3_g15569 [Colletotrichum fructicola]KAE9568269.1 hypothetical protein CGMCC3_g15569 [Colletotrichum fructicola]